ncbi:MAG: hypothetical protein C0434_04420 [Xanthomonadaceae bacterium]|nr:hypothetical protein [Xanthomonadaceae bacterium]
MNLEKEVQMSEQISLVETKLIEPNPENPRLIFHQDELDALQESIKVQGILVPLTIYRDGKGFRILDGERRWRCAVKLGFAKVPAIAQPKPDKFTNLLMMFAIHHRRNEWDPLPTALKLQVLEDMYAERHEVRPTEKQLAELASLTRGEVRRYKKLLALPEKYKSMLLEELTKPRSQQILTVDHVIEAAAAAQSLSKRGIISEKEEDVFREAVVDKFKTKVIESTVDPRSFSRLSRAVERDELPMQVARKAVHRFINEPTYTVRQMFTETVEDQDYQHGTNQIADRLIARLVEVQEREYELSPALRDSLIALVKLIRNITKG